MATSFEALAHRTIHIPPSSPMSALYASSLRKFVAAHPYDTNFIIMESGNDEYIMCLESGCNNFNYFLSDHTDALNSKDGAFGPLNRYAHHVENNNAHILSRQSRLNHNQPYSFEQPFDISPNLLSQDPFRSQAMSMKPTPSRKRPSDCIELSDSEDESPKLKRRRSDASTKLPLGTIDRNVPPSPVRESFSHATFTQPTIGHFQATSAPPVAMQFVPGTPMQGAPTPQAPTTTTSFATAPFVATPTVNSFPIAQAIPSSSGLPPPSVVNPTSAYANPLVTSSQQLPNFNDFASNDLTTFEDYDDDSALEQEDFSAFIATGRRFMPGRGYASVDVRSFIEQYSQEGFGSDSTVKDGLQKLHLQELGECLPGMTTSLLAHQVIGVAWMKAREEAGARYCRGGILADAMGLGKTVQTIGLICANPSDDPGCQATLIVAPLALLEQWKQEIMWKTEEDTFKVLIYHGPNRPKSTKVLAKYNIILTTYHTLANEWPDESRKKAKKKDDFIVDDDDSNEKKKFGPLMDINWYRVVLDEAQCIRNHKTRASIVATHLIAERRWCLTGTPLTNGLLDAFGLLRFIEHNPFADWDRFRRHIMVKNESLGAKRLQHIFGPVIMRRNKESTLEGRNIIELPRRNEDWVELTMSPEEREIYDFVEKKSQVRFNRFLQAGTVLKNYSQVLVMLMRLRQICVHPCLLKAYESAFEVADTRSPEAKKVVEDAANLVSNAFVALVKKNLRDAEGERMKNEKLKGSEATIDDSCPICFEPFGPDAIVAAPCAHQFCLPCIQEHIGRPRSEEDSKFKDHERDCPCCRQVISLNLLFERAPFEPTNEELGVADENLDSLEISWTVGEDGKGSYVAKVDKKRRKSRSDDSSDLEDFVVDDNVVEYDDASFEPRSRASRRASRTSLVIQSDESEDELPAPKVKTEEGGDEYIHSDNDESDDEMDALDRIRLFAKKPEKVQVKKEAKEAVINLDSDFEDKKPQPSTSKRRALVDPIVRPTMMSSFVPSTKLHYMMQYIEEVAKSNPDDKTMVVSQWTSALDLCGDYLREHGITFVKYQGDMNLRQRNEAVNKFMIKPKVTVMLMSVKCGGIGLNLTRASRVISLDMSWNAATDQQCFDRTHRLGQQREVFIERLTVKDSVEQRMRAIQERKQGLSDAALGEGSFNRVRLTVGELATLFGLAPGN